MTEITTVDVNSEEYKRALNDYNSYIGAFAEGFVTKIYSNGIIDEVEAETIKKYLSNPDTFQKEIEDLAQYYYISTGEVHQLFDLVEALPSLNYKVESHDKAKSTERHVSIINRAMHKVKHKRLTRDLIKQDISSGTVVGMWLGDKTNPFPYVFDEAKYIFPAYRRNGEWVCVLDMTWLSKLSEFDRKIQLANLEPFVTLKDYNAYLKDTLNKQYFELPQERTFVLRTGILKRNQNLGTSWITPGMYDILHKKKLKDVESAVANKIINAIAVLTVGTDKMDGKYTNLQLPKGVKRAIHGGVKTALTQNQKNGVTVVTIPDYAKLEFPTVNTDGLNNKFEDVNSDIYTSFGISSAITSGSGTNSATAQINYDAIYKRIGVLLEDIEQDCYQKLINLILPSNQEDNYYIEYEKEQPLTLKDKLTTLTKLNDKGWSTKAVVDNLSGISWEQYLDETIYETEILKLQDRIKPYLQSSTLSSKDIQTIQDGGNTDTTVNNPNTNDNTTVTEESSTTTVQ